MDAVVVVGLREGRGVLVGGGGEGVEGDGVRGRSRQAGGRQRLSCISAPRTETRTPEGERWMLTEAGSSPPPGIFSQSCYSVADVKIL